MAKVDVADLTLATAAAVQELRDLFSGASELRGFFAGPHRRDVVTVPEGESMTRQEFTDECDVNQIMARYEKNGIWPVQNGMVEPRYLDFGNMPDNLMEALEQISQASEAFMMLPASVRKEFDNDAARFVEFASDGNNLGKLREWGLAEPEKVPPGPMEVKIVGEPAPATPVPAAPGPVGSAK